ncbi:hypothetical protein RHS01_08495 [Rhizoctonia solani]|uniref:Uncharacterized protein n=1 Tax=Rhizoctonia solani TaxID=456999 RepID=A0A8H7I5I3_9AGAM|nr:hypothetical protein RHS01_08495 [Rhizoctonia solani]
MEFGDDVLCGGSTGPASPLFVSGSESEEWVERRLSAGTTTSSSGDESNDKAALYAGYPLTFQRRDDERSRKGSWTSLKDLGAPGTPRNSSPVPQSASSEPQNTTYSLQNSSISPQPIHNLYAADITPTQSLYSVSAQGLLVRPALLRAKTELTSLSPLDDAPRLYHPSSVPMSRNGSGTRPSSIRHASTPSAPNSPTYRKVTPSQSHSRRRSEVLSQSSLSDANRTKSSDSIKSKNFMPLYPALVMPPAPQTRMVKKWVVEEERLVEREVEEVQEQGERKRMFTFNTKMSHAIWLPTYRFSTVNDHHDLVLIYPSELLIEDEHYLYLRDIRLPPSLVIWNAIRRRGVGLSPEYLQRLIDGGALVPFSFAQLLTNPRIPRPAPARALHKLLQSLQPMTKALLVGAHMKPITAALTHDDDQRSAKALFDHRAFVPYSLGDETDVGSLHGAFTSAFAESYAKGNESPLDALLESETVCTLIKTDERDLKSHVLVEAFAIVGSELGSRLLRHDAFWRPRVNIVEALLRLNSSEASLARFMEIATTRSTPFPPTNGRMSGLDYTPEAIMHALSSKLSQKSRRMVHQAPQISRSDIFLLHIL